MIWKRVLSVEHNWYFKQQRTTPKPKQKKIEELDSIVQRAQTETHFNCGTDCRKLLKQIYIQYTSLEYLIYTRIYTMYIKKRAYDISMIIIKSNCRTGPFLKSHLHLKYVQ